MKKLSILFSTVLFVFAFSISVFANWVEENGGGWKFYDSDGSVVTETIVTSGEDKYYLGEDGSIMTNYFLEDYNGNSYYFDASGKLVYNVWVAVESQYVSNQDDYVPEHYWYYFGPAGKALKGSSQTPKKQVIDGKKYLLNEFGQMCIGWVDAQGKTINPSDDNPFANAMYYCGDDNDGVLRAGWVTYYYGYDEGDDWLLNKETLYFYFNTTSNKKIGYDGATTKKINGKTYAFGSDGLMLSGWDYYESNETIAALDAGITYFSGENDGSQVKKGWVYAVPSSVLYNKGYEDGEEKWFYFNNSGVSEVDTIKKINSKYYAFDKRGIMRTGLIVWCEDGAKNNMQLDSDYHVVVGDKFICKIDMDNAKLEEIAKKGILRYGSGANDYIKVNPQGKIAWADGAYYNDYTYNPSVPMSDLRKDTIKLQYFDVDGARKTGTNKVELDEVFDFESNSRGDKGSDTQNKKYFSLGVLLKANPDIKYGIVVQKGSSFANNEPGNGWEYTNYIDDDFRTYGRFHEQGYIITDGHSAGDRYSKGLERKAYKVVNTNGKLVKGDKKAKKDANGNYWFIDKDKDNTLTGIYTKPVKRGSDKVLVKGTYKANIQELIQISTAMAAAGGGGCIIQNADKLMAGETVNSLEFKKVFGVVDIFDVGTTGPDNYNFIMRPHSKDARALYSCVYEQSFDEPVYWGTTWQQGIHLDVASCKNANSNKSGYSLTDDIILKLHFFMDNVLYYKSDYNGKEQWLPFGFRDDNNRCCSWRYENNLASTFDGHDPRPDKPGTYPLDYYQVVPDNDYFLNCYWDD